MVNVAIVHDPIFVYGGAEKVLEELAAMYPDAPIYVPFFDPKVLPTSLKGREFRTSWLQRARIITRFHRALFPIYPFVYNAMDVSGFDLVISSSFNFAHNVSVPSEATHICYCHSPPRFLWDYAGYASREGFGTAKRLVIEAFLPWLRSNDRTAAMGVDRWIATSELVKRRIWRSYRRESDIVAPAIDVEEFTPSVENDGYLLVLMRLVGWKRADIVVKACTDLGLPLVVAGNGRDFDRLKSMAGETVTFVGRVDGQRKRELYARCRAFVLPSIEDFGITPLEAMASGKPVIAFGEGGVLDTVIAGTNGEFFFEQTAESLMTLLRTFDSTKYDAAKIRMHAMEFDRAHFRHRIADLVEMELSSGKNHSSR